MSKSKATKRKPEPAPTLAELLAKADGLFNHDKPSGCYQFTIGRFPHGWTFSVVNSWHRWSGAGRTHQFGPCPTPEEAIIAFLSSVKDNGMWVEQLQD